MKSIFSRVGIVAVTVWLSLAAGAVNAGVPTITSFSGTAETGYNAAFYNIGLSSTFNDLISFTMPVDASGNGGSNVISLGGGGVVFTAFNLYESANLIATGILNGADWFLSFAGGATPGNYTLNMAGYKLSTATASYAGNISISPVPEPETYAMLLAGLGLIGFSIRRRKNETFD